MKNHLLVALLTGVVVACGSAETVVQPAPAPPVTEPPVEETPPVEKPPTPAVDHGAVSTKYPAFAPAMGQLAQNGGKVLKNPVVVTVTWAGDPNVEALEAMGDQLGTSAYWKDTTFEYGTLGATSGAENHVRLPDAPPSSMSDTQLEAYVQASVASGLFPTPASGEPIYILHLQKATQLMLGGKSACSQGVGGYHDSTKSGTPIAFAIVPRCGSSFDSVTVAASHELAEAATDPYPTTKPAWTGFRAEDLAWEFFQQFQSENGDACEFYRDSDLGAGVESGLAVTVQRTWSNKSAAAGHDPCVPVFRGATFFNTTPIGLEPIDVDLSAIGGDVVTTMGYKVPVGKTRTIPLGFYSDGPMTAWNIKAVMGGIAGGSKSGVDLELDVDSGQNGQKAYLTVTVNTAGRTGSELITIVSTRGGTSHYMPILIGSTE
jgi:hypothetical protein